VRFEESISLEERKGDRCSNTERGNERYRKKIGLIDRGGGG